MVTLACKIQVSRKNTNFVRRQGPCLRSWVEAELLLLPCNLGHECKTYRTAICRQMQQAWEAVPWLEVKCILAANHTSVAHSLTSAFLGSWWIGHASYDKAVVLWQKDTI